MGAYHKILRLASVVPNFGLFDIHNANLAVLDAQGNLTVEAFVFPLPQLLRKPLHLVLLRCSCQLITSSATAISNGASLQASASHTRLSPPAAGLAFVAGPPASHESPEPPYAAGVYRMLSFCRTVAAYPQSQPEFCMATSVEFSWTLKNSVGYSS